MSYLIRPAESSDLAGIYTVEKACFPDPYPRTLLDNLIKTEAGRFFVAVHAGELLGYAVATTNRGEGHVVSVAVSMTHRRRGIGTQLLSATLRSLKELGIYHVHLEVRKGNKTAISFYERMGFKRQSELKHYYPDGEDAVVLGCALN